MSDRLEAGLQPELLYDDLAVGSEFGELRFPLDAERVRRYIEASGDANPIYTDADAARAAGLPGSIAPPGLWGVWGRQGYLREHRMPGGGVLAGQDIEFCKPVPVGETLSVNSRVTDRYEKKGRRFVVFETRAEDSRGELCGLVRITAIWPK